ncbi:DUF167 domain-containing protein [Leisingera sp.]|uniref:DUF167 domain-containing protein n=1 Tax=Leisingera sp. TaxID=1879318 RepID=UPI003A94493E
MGKPKRKDLPDLGHLCVPGQQIAVRAQPRSARDAVAQADDGSLRVMVKEPPENGKATEAIRRLLARAMGVAASQLELCRGATSRNKLFVYTGPVGSGSQRG